MAGDIGIFIGLISVVSGIAVVAVAFFGAYLFGKSRGHEPVGSGRDPELMARISRIEQTVEATAVEIERISEGQRFTTRLLSEKKAFER
jgi:hypothetical protein